jgi:hypothetical protein
MADMSINVKTINFNTKKRSVQMRTEFLEYPYKTLYKKKTSKIKALSINIYIYIYYCTYVQLYIYYFIIYKYLSPTPHLCTLLYNPYKARFLLLTIYNH